jgi:hypothetical protein
MWIIANSTPYYCQLKYIVLPDLVATKLVHTIVLIELAWSESPTTELLPNLLCMYREKQ